MSNLPEVIRQIRQCDSDRPYIFISYSQRDRDLVWRDVLEFQNRGYNVWLDEKNLDKTKDSWKEDALDAIEDMDCMLVVFYVSADSLSSDACYQELRRTVADRTIALHFGPVKFIAVDVENIGDITEFHRTVFEKIKNSRRDKEERKKQALALNGFMNQFFNSNNEKVRIHPKYEKGRKMDYYEDITAAFPDEARIYPAKEMISVAKPEENDAPEMEGEEEKKPVSECTENLEKEFVSEIQICEERGGKELENENAATVRKARRKEFDPEDYFTYALKKEEGDRLQEEKWLEEKDLRKAEYLKGNYHIENGYTKIKRGFGGRCLFKGRSDVRKVKLPDSIKEIQNEEFRDCISLEKIQLPEYIEKINFDTFWNCVSLRSVVIPGGVTEIESRAFCGCSSLKCVKLPLELKKIGTAAFRNCSYLEELYLPPTLESMRSLCFENCTSLQRIIVPGSLKKLEAGVFCRCSSLEMVYLMDGVKEIDSAFKRCGERLHIRIPDSVEEISLIAFYQTGAVIHCSKDSYAYEYAKEHHIPCITDDTTEAFFQDLNIDAYQKLCLR